MRKKPEFWPESPNNLLQSFLVIQKAFNKQWFATSQELEIFFQQLLGFNEELNAIIKQNTIAKTTKATNSSIFSFFQSSKKESEADDEPSEEEKQRIYLKENRMTIDWKILSPYEILWHYIATKVDLESYLKSHTLQHLCAQTQTLYQLYEYNILPPAETIFAIVESKETQPYNPSLKEFGELQKIARFLQYVCMNLWTFCPPQDGKVLPNIQLNDIIVHEAQNMVMIRIPSLEKTVIISNNPDDASWVTNANIWPELLKKNHKHELEQFKEQWYMIKRIPMSWKLSSDGKTKEPDRILWYRKMANALLITVETPIDTTKPTVLTSTPYMRNRKLDLKKMEEMREKLKKAWWTVEKFLSTWSTANKRQKLDDWLKGIWLSLDILWRLFLGKDSSGKNQNYCNPKQKFDHCVELSSAIYGNQATIIWLEETKKIKNNALSQERSLQKEKIRSQITSTFSVENFIMSWGLVKWSWQKLDLSLINSQTSLIQLWTLFLNRNHASEWSQYFNPSKKRDHFIELVSVIYGVNVVQEWLQNIKKMKENKDIEQRIIEQSQMRDILIKWWWDAKKFILWRKMQWSKQELDVDLEKLWTSLFKLWTTFVGKNSNGEGENYFNPRALKKDFLILVRSLYNDEEVEKVLVSIDEFLGKEEEIRILQPQEQMRSKLINWWFDVVTFLRGWNSIEGKAQINNELKKALNTSLWSLSTIFIKTNNYFNPLTNSEHFIQLAYYIYGTETVNKSLIDVNLLLKKEELTAIKNYQEERKNRLTQWEIDVYCFLKNWRNDWKDNGNKNFLDKVLGEIDTSLFKLWTIFVGKNSNGRGEDYFNPWNNRSHALMLAWYIYGQDQVKKTEEEMIENEKKNAINIIKNLYSWDDFIKQWKNKALRMILSNKLPISIHNLWTLLLWRNAHSWFNPVSNPIYFLAVVIAIYGEAEVAPHVTQEQLVQAKQSMQS